jgi:hypothetical protein
MSTVETGNARIVGAVKVDEAKPLHPDSQVVAFVGRQPGVIDRVIEGFDAWLRPVHRLIDEHVGVQDCHRPARRGKG